MAEALTQTRMRPARLDGMTPIEVAAGLRHLPGLVFFDSAGNLPSTACQPASVIAARPTRILRGSIHAEADRAVLRTAVAQGPPAHGDQGFPLGGLCGWLEYEGDFVFGDFPEMLVFNHRDRTWWECGGLSECLRHTTDAPAVIGGFSANTSHEQYLDDVARIKEWITAGDIYQVNLSQTFEARVAGGSLFGLYEILREASPAPMAAWLSLDGRELLGSSPESFLKISGRGIETRPIKGTRPRFEDPDEDRRSAYELQTSAKEIAELVMITDLLRNDLGQVCEFGSVEVSEMLQLESLAQVHHLVSTVSGTLRAETDAIDALAACFPGGSITGAPKKRAMEIIRELEDAPRGNYCGAVGWLGYHGESSFNIAIRTLVRSGGRLVYQVGAGIVADSEPEKEYEETLHKATGIRLAVERWPGNRMD
ncbi:MAG: aminodeoxychorismate synthase component I [Luteolibacter sp.]|jgi:aminodeoxychorismate synthase component I|nr:aminodeoxychorismate synthase component I [Luteolibacter sp.]